MATDSEHTREFVGLIVRHQAKMRAFIISLMPGVPGVADVLQETNLVLWEKMKTFKSGTNFTAWAFTVARFEVMTHCRKLRRQEAAMKDSKLIEEIADQIEMDFAEGDGVIESRVEALKICMQRLSDEERDVVRRRYSTGWSLAEYARQTGLSASSLRTKLQRLRVTLRKCIAARLAMPGPPPQMNP
jgi:RNA polymerase sigma-70 factor (ECF subfamily)